MLSSRKTSAKTYRIRYYHFWGLCKIIWVSGMGVNTVKVVLLFPTPMHAFLSLLSLRLPFCEMKNRLYRNVKHCSNTWTVKFLMFKLVLEKAEDQRSNCQHMLDHQKSKRIPEKHLFLLYWLCQSLWLCASQ